MAGQPQRELELRILEFIYDHQSERTNAASIGAIRQLVGDEHAAATVLKALRDRDLVRTNQSLNPCYFTTADGAATVEDMVARRGNRGHRRAAARDQLLAWVDSNSPSRGSRLDRDLFTGGLDLVEFTDDDVEDAASHLVTHGLLRSHSSAQKAHFLLVITDEGRDCIDHGHGVAAYLARNQAVGNVMQVHGTGHNIAAAFGPDSNATATRTEVNVDLAILLAAAVRQAADSDALELPGTGEVNEALADIEQRDDVSRVRRGVTTLGRLLGDASTGALGSVLGALAAQALGLSL